MRTEGRIAGGAVVCGQIHFVRPTVIGRWVVVRLLGAMSVRERPVRATVMDTVAGENLPKRVRVQTRGVLQGRVLMPGEYEIVRFL